MNGFKRLILTLSLFSWVGCAPGTPLGGKRRQASHPAQDQCQSPAVSALDAELPGVAGFDEHHDSYIIKVRGSSEISSLAHDQKLSSSLRQGEDLGHGFFKVSGLGARADRLAEIASLPEVEYIEPDYRIYLSETRSKDPQMSKQWAHRVVGSQAAWEISAGNTEIVVAIIDSGVDYTHKDLAGNIWRNPGEVANGRDDDGNGYIDDLHGWDFVERDASPRPRDANSHHGTHVAGIVGAVGGNGIGVIGHSPEVKLMPLRFIKGKDGGLTSDAIRAINYAVRMGAHILNNSWGSSRYSKAMYDAISASERAGVLFVVAAGNSGGNNDTVPWYPASYPHSNIISVAATSYKDRLPSWSNYGKYRVDIAAPGSSIFSTGAANSYKYMSGTSMAAPLVSGVAATLLALRPELTPKQLISILKSSSTKLSSLRSKVASGGRINAAAALRALASHAPITPPAEDDEENDDDFGDGDGPNEKPTPDCGSGL